jgi:hypothetical protein
MASLVAVVECYIDLRSAAIGILVGLDSGLRHSLAQFNSA